jgi:DMSO/TMAO reductase YedYZ heme-binding membrane subunit
MINKFARNVTILCIILFTAYATLRYNIFKGIPFSEFPLYILNKSISWTGLALIVLSYLISTWKKLGKNIPALIINSKRDLGVIGFAFISAHILISVINLNPMDYSKLYANDNSLNLLGQLSLLYGALSYIILNIPFINSFRNEELKKHEKWKKVQNLGYISIFGVLLHLFFMGYKGWLDFSSWAGGLPPITLLASFLVLILLILRLILIMKNKY